MNLLCSIRSDGGRYDFLAVDQTRVGREPDCGVILSDKFIAVALHTSKHCIQKTHLVKKNSGAPRMVRRSVSRERYIPPRRAVAGICEPVRNECCRELIRLP